MSLTLRVAAMIALLSAVTAGLSWFVAHRLVFRPLVEDVYGAFQAEVAFIGDRLDRGGDPRRLERALDLQLRPAVRPPPANWRTEIVGGRRLVRPPGPRTLMLVQTDQGWIEVRRALDLERPGRQLPVLFALVTLGVAVLAFGIARRSVRPVRIASQAMSRMAAGDLEHRLEEVGPTELRTAATAFNALADRITSQLRSEKRLMAGISHELRTPLTRLRLEIELLRDAGVDPGRLGRMEGDLEQLDDLVGEALALSQLQLGQRRLEPSPVELGPVIDTIVGELGLAHRVERHGELSLVCDARLTDRALRNLLQNAVKYTPADTPIQVTLDDTGVEIRDHGPGVPDADLEHLFEPFYRTDSGSRRAEGHGLGLMIVRQVMDLHGGRVSARNAEPGLAVKLRFS